MKSWSAEAQRPPPATHLSRDIFVIEPSKEPVDEAGVKAENPCDAGCRHVKVQLPGFCKF